MGVYIYNNFFIFLLSIRTRSPAQDGLQILMSIECLVQSIQFIIRSSPGIILFYCTENSSHNTSYGIRVAGDMSVTSRVIYNQDLEKPGEFYSEACILKFVTKALVIFVY